MLFAGDAEELALKLLHLLVLVLEPLHGVLGDRFHGFQVLAGAGLRAVLPLQRRGLEDGRPHGV